MKYATEIGSVALIYKFNKDWFRHSKFGKGGYTDRMESS
jgi:hypothetical protein